MIWFWDQFSWLTFFLWLLSSLVMFVVGCFVGSGYVLREWERVAEEPEVPPKRTRGYRLHTIRFDRNPTSGNK